MSEVIKWNPENKPIATSGRGVNLAMGLRAFERKAKYHGKWEDDRYPHPRGKEEEYPREEPLKFFTGTCDSDDTDSDDDFNDPS